MNDARNVRRARGTGYATICKQVTLSTTSTGHSILPADYLSPMRGPPQGGTCTQMCQFCARRASGQTPSFGLTWWPSPESQAGERGALDNVLPVFTTCRVR
jgi:hypothetical protein